MKGIKRIMGAQPALLLSAKLDTVLSQRRCSSGFTLQSDSNVGVPRSQRCNDACDIECRATCMLVVAYAQMNGLSHVSRKQADAIRDMLRVVYVHADGRDLDVAEYRVWLRLRFIRSALPQPFAFTSKLDNARRYVSCPSNVSPISIAMYAERFSDRECRSGVTGMLSSAW